MMNFLQLGDKANTLTSSDMEKGLYRALDRIGKKKNVLVIPPDITRLHSRAGELTEMVMAYYGPNLTAVLPALGTHRPMTAAEMKRMYGKVPAALFHEHDWRDGIVTLGEVPGEFVAEVSGGKIDFPWPAQVDKLLIEGDFDVILSIGQVVPHEVVGMASYNKNIFVGTGGPEGINKSHFLGAVFGMEKMMGRVDTPVRRVLNYASEHFAADLPIIYVHTVVESTPDGPITRGLFIGDDSDCFHRAAQLSLQVNFQMLDAPLKKVIVYLPPEEFKTTWLGNKSIYRTRMAMADQGELIVLAPGLVAFGEDREIDHLIRKYGYIGTENILKLTKENKDLKNNLSAAAHLIHGSSEGRFKIIYCPGQLTKAEIEAVNFEYNDLNDMMEKYDPGKLVDGINTVDGEDIYYISNPAMGLWVWRQRFK
jgi:nickel-dependent lactate racemase